MTTYDPSTRGIYDTAAASTQGWYYLCRLGTGQVVQITWLAAENPDVQRLPTPLAGAAFYDIIEKVDTVYRINNNLNIADQIPRDWAPWTYTQCAAAHRQSLQRPTVTGRGPTVTPSTAEPQTQRHVVFPIPLGIIMSAECAREIVAGWTLDSWRNEWLRQVTFEHPTMFITNNCGLGDAYLPPLPFGFNDPNTFITSWTVNHPRENTSIGWHVTRGNTAPLGSRDPSVPALATTGFRSLRTQMTEAEHVITMGWENGMPACIVYHRQDTVPNLAVEVIDLTSRMRSTRSTGEVLTTIYGAWPRPAEPEEEEEDPDMLEARRRAMAGVTRLRAATAEAEEVELTREQRLQAAFGDPANTDRPPPPTNWRQRQNARRDLQERRAQNRATAQTATDAIRMTALQHGTVNFSNETHWPNPDHANRREIVQMTDQELWNALTYLIRNRTSLHVYYAEERDRDIVPECWLRDRPLFETMLNQSLVRTITYADDVATYLATYCTSMPDEEVDVPWNDESARDEQRELREILEARRKALERAEDADRQLRRFDLG